MNLDFKDIIIIIVTLLVIFRSAYIYWTISCEDNDPWKFIRYILYIIFLGCLVLALKIFFVNPKKLLSLETAILSIIIILFCVVSDKLLTQQNAFCVAAATSPAW